MNYFHAWKDLNIQKRIFLTWCAFYKLGFLTYFYLCCKQMFLSGMDFSGYEVIRLACQSHKLQEKPLLRQNVNSLP